jgi:hypothetical protein
MSVSLLKRTAPPLSPERRALAEAISGCAAADRRREARTLAAETASAAVWTATAAVTAATLAVEEAKRNAARYLTAQTMGEAADPPATIREARLKLQDAQDDLETRQAVRDALKLEIAQDRTWSEPNSGTVRDAALAVIYAEAPGYAAALLAEVQGLMRQLVAKGSALTWLGKAGMFPTVRAPGVTYGQPIDAEAQRTICRMDVSPNRWTVSMGGGEPPFALPIGAAAWEGALEALMADASAPLPR